MFSRSDAASVAAADSVAVIGLGRFGRALALELMANGTEVLGIDADESIVQELNGHLTHVVCADSTREEVLKQLAVPEFDRVVVSIGSDIQASILTTSLLLRSDVEHLWAKAVNDAHGTILEQLGVRHVVYPEKEMGRRVAHLVRGSMQDYLEIGDGFSLVKMAPPLGIVGKSLGESRVRSTAGVTITAVRPKGGTWTHTSETTVIAASDTILVSGPTAKAEAFSLRR
ncbi:trk system potassium uptake protein TrkA [Rhodoglobus vestalii]|uniref:Trk system potassium uptake protein TrkA n=2 Tax=Rhodoglobus vestalii TaxID=193384 RepID=A0A8H2PUI8_9MICO|nr:trk system potassium uptake protein TrkA [Rhodoglobus vestalii]